MVFFSRGMAKVPWLPVVMSVDNLDCSPGQHHLTKPQCRSSNGGTGRDKANSVSLKAEEIFLVFSK